MHEINQRHQVAEHYMLYGRIIMLYWKNKTGTGIKGKGVAYCLSEK